MDRGLESLFGLGLPFDRPPLPDPFLEVLLLRELFPDPLREPLLELLPEPLPDPFLDDEALEDLELSRLWSFGLDLAGYFPLPSGERLGLFGLRWGFPPRPLPGLTLRRFWEGRPLLSIPGVDWA